MDVTKEKKRGGGVTLGVDLQCDIDSVEVLLESLTKLDAPREQCQKNHGLNPVKIGRLDSQEDMQEALHQ